MHCGLVHPVDHVKPLWMKLLFALDGPHHRKEWQRVEDTVAADHFFLEAGMEEVVEEVVQEL